MHSHFIDAMADAETVESQDLVDEQLISDLEAALKKRSQNPALPEIDVPTHEIFEIVDDTKRRVASLGLCTVTANGMCSVQAFFHREESKTYEHFSVSKLAARVAQAAKDPQTEVISVKRQTLDPFLKLTLDA